MRLQAYYILLLGVASALGILSPWSTRALAAQARLVVLNEPGGVAVGVAVVVNAGSVWEMKPEAGLTYLAARSLMAELRPALGPLGGRTAVECDQTGIRFTLLLPVATWATGTELFLDAIFGGSISDAAVELARQEILREAALAEGSLATEIRTTLAAEEFGDTDRWARPACGTAETIARLGASDARRLARTRFTPYRATAAVAGPVGEAVPHALLSRYLPDSELPVLVPSPTRGPAGQMRWVERNTVTAWTGIAFPFPQGANLEALRLLAFQIEREVGPAPERPEIYDAAVEIARDGAGGALVVYLVTSTTQTRQWVDRVSALVHTAADTEMQESVFDALLRRYTGQRLLELESPEGRALDAALQLFFEQTFTQPAARIAALTPTMLRESAAALGRPAVASLGPR